MINFSYTDYYKKRIEEKEKERELKRVIKPLPVIQGPKESILTAVKKEIEKDYNQARDFLILPRYIKFLKILIIILAFLLIVFLLYKNFISEEKFNYFYNIGDSEENYLSPNYRISEIAETNGITYRNLTSNLVYFNVPVPRGSKTLKADVKFKDSHPDTILVLGGKDRQDWHYQWKTLYNKQIENLTNYYQDSNYYIYKINPDLENLAIDEIEKSENLIIGTDIDLVNNPNKQKINKFTTLINTSIRGGHTFYIYTFGNLYMEVKKQDLNWYNGSDQLEIELYDSQNNFLYSIEIEDDGIVTAASDKKLNNIQEGILDIDNLPEGVYKIEFKNFDGLIREIKINTDKIVVANIVYLADSNIFFNDIEKNSILYTEVKRNKTISFKSWHNQGFQNITINNGSIKNQSIEIKERVNETIFNLILGNYTVLSSKNDYIISYPGYFAFSKENYFEPYKNNIITIKSNKDWINKNIDYLILDYNSALIENDWKIATIEFDLDDLYYKDKLSMVFNVPHLTNEDYKNQTVQIDWINITIFKPGL